MYQVEFYKCDDCGGLFLEDELRVEHDREYANNGVGMECVRDDSYFVCPKCGSSNLSECKEDPGDDENEEDYG